MFKVMLKDSSNLEKSLLQSLACLPDHNYANEIENFKENQRINNESIQHLADSIAQIPSTISQMQVSNASYHEPIRENTKSFESNLSQHRNSSNSDCIIVHNQSSLLSANTYDTENNEHCC